MLNMTIGRVKGCKTGSENRVEPVSKRTGGRSRMEPLSKSSGAVKVSSLVRRCFSRFKQELLSSKLV
jgi:hypothetical protein